jgi:Prasinovirus endonuclease VII
MTRAYQWQMKQKALGNCLWCGKPAGGFTRCEVHRKWFRTYAKKFRSRDLEKSRERDRLKAKRLFDLNPDKLRATRRAYYVKNKEKMRAKANEARAKNLQKFRDRDKARRPQTYQRKKERWHSDPIYKLEMRLRNALNRSLRKKSVKKTDRALELLGCPIEDFAIYIESKFDVGMTWQNWGNKSDQWNLDHIMPVALFDLSKESHQKRCFHFSNYQPLWRPDNSAKGIKTPINHQFRMF